MSGIATGDTAHAQAVQLPLIPASGKQEPAGDTAAVTSQEPLERLSLTRHLHTCNHNVPSQCVSVADVAARYRRVDAIIIENHNDYQPPVVAAPPDGPLVLPGKESATPIHSRQHPLALQHAGILGVDAVQQRTLKITMTEPTAVTLQKVHRAGGDLVYNHPEYPYIQTAGSSARALAYTVPTDEAKLFDAVELFNDAGFKGGNPANVLRWVEQNFYNQGVFPAIVAGQDDHGPAPISAHPTYTLAMVHHRREADIMEAIRARHTFVSKSLDAQLAMSMDGKSTWERNGPVVPGQHRFSTSLSGLPEGAVIEIVRSGEVIGRTVAKDGHGELSLSLDVPAANKRADYLYVRVWTSPGQLHTVGSAVPLNAG